MTTLAELSPTDSDMEAVARLARMSRFGPIADIERELTRMEAENPGAELVRGWLRARLHARRSEFHDATMVLVGLLRRLGMRSEFSIQLRVDLVDVLLMGGHPERAERAIRKTLAAADFGRFGWKYQAILNNELGRLYRRRGLLSLASSAYQAALKHDAPGCYRWFVELSNLIHSDLRADRLDQVKAGLSQLTAAEDRGGDPPVDRFLTSASWLSYLIEVGRPQECEPYLAKLRSDRGTSPTSRNYLLLQNYEADVLLLSGAVREAAALYHQALASSVAVNSLADLAPSLARGLAECMFRLEEYEACEDHARLAIRLAAKGDRLEQLIAHRVLGECYWARGHREEARRQLHRALALHTGLEFVRERVRLEQTIVRLEIPAPDSSGATGQPLANVHYRSRSRPTNLPLRDGRAFWTFDSGLVTQLQVAAASKLPVLIEGETGTGKELVARLLHELGPLGEGPFMVADCTALPDNLVEAELFGVVRGAFTGCTETRDGIVARANGGTLLLDELPELSMASQAKLLRLLQEGTYRRVGDAAVRRVDARFIAATNRPVDELLSARALKLDLYHRLNGHRIRLHPLRERKEELGLLAAMILERSGHAGPTDAAVRQLEQYDWPGNFRELEMMLRVIATELRPGEVLDLDLLMNHLPCFTSSRGPLRQRRIEGEKRALDEALRRSAGNVSAAARSLGISRQAFYKALERTGGREPK